MSKWNNKDIIAVHYNDKNIIKIYKGLRLVWEILGEALSCFGSGYWIDSRPWLDQDGWKN